MKRIPKYFDIYIDLVPKLTSVACENYGYFEGTCHLDAEKNIARYTCWFTQHPFAIKTIQEFLAGDVVPDFAVELKTEQHPGVERYKIRLTFILSYKIVETLKARAEEEEDK